MIGHNTGQMVRQVVKEEIGYIDLVFIVILSDGISVLVYQLKIAYSCDIS
jgi:hypothetical protein